MAADPRTAPWRKVPLRSKYGNKKTEVGGIVFDSKKEARRWAELKLMMDAGEITNLQRQVKYELIPAIILDGKKQRAIHYVADFQYIKDGIFTIEDSKGFKTDVWKIKRRLMKHIHGLEVVES